MTDDADGLRRKATRFEDLVPLINDAKAIQALHDLARSYRQQADQLSATDPDGQASGGLTAPNSLSDRSEK